MYLPACLYFHLAVWRSLPPPPRLSLSLSTDPIAVSTLISSGDIQHGDHSYTKLLAIMRVKVLVMTCLNKLFNHLVSVEVSRPAFSLVDIVAQALEGS